MARSSTSARIPASFRASAEAIPLGPAPTTTTSRSLIVPADHSRCHTAAHTLAAWRQKPVVMAVDDDVRALERIRAELDRRYTHDYRIVCHRSAEAAAKDLASLREAGEEVAVVLADQWTAGLPGTALLARARELHPLARRALLIEWGGWADRPTAEAIFEGMARATWTTT